MKKLVLLLLVLTASCKNNNESEADDSASTSKREKFSEVHIENILEDDSLSIRAIQVIGENLAFAANKGTYGLYNVTTKTWKTNTQAYDSIYPEFRAIASTSNDFFMLGVGSPALLYKTGNNGQLELVYKEDDEKAFYDSMTFWNDTEGIAMGDPTDGCISIIITRDAGKNWKKLDCEQLPATADGEAAFAASNSNIAIYKDETWILTGGMKSRILYSPDKGKNWKIFDTPLVQGTATSGGYSVDFFNSEIGFIIGGDYTKFKENNGNKAITGDGGKTWNLVAERQEPGYRSSVKFVPGGDGDELVAVGFEGIDYSKDGGETWSELSEEGFFTIRFINDSTAYAAGSGRVAKLRFK
ncbi:oxidoreductase [uncultured Christiangramia sp.]|uniref:WD40/YVTN/BNR-like repeat-containing protein n=1 Tax=uncultured Christiangramia sp. TaxID=503836 RepID=UPI002611EDDB|nr:oxidoreductase [uncultured Christiangramia sp.]